MNAIKPLLLATMLVLPVGALSPSGPAAALSATSSVDSRIRLDWEAGARHGRPVIQGWVYNDFWQAAKDVRLLVETLDASGNVIARDFGFVRGTVQFNSRTYFEVPLKDDRRLLPGECYGIRLELPRVSVTAFDWNCR